MHSDAGEFRRIGVCNAISYLKAGFLRHCELNGAEKCWTFDWRGHYTKEIDPKCGSLSFDLFIIVAFNPIQTCTLLKRSNIYLKLRCTVQFITNMPDQSIYYILELNELSWEKT